MESSSEAASPQCQFFVVRKKRLCRMTVRPGRSYCGEHEPEPRLQSGQDDTRIPCPNDPKHTCYASKLQKHLSICNARAGELPPYIVPGVNAPAPAAAPRRALALVPREALLRLVEKVNRLYDEYVRDSIMPLEEQELHAAVAGECAQAGRAEGSRRHLRQVSGLLRAAEAARLVQDHTCYVELGAGKGHLSYYVWRAWCAGARGSRVLLVDRAALRHKRDNKLRDLAAAQQEEDESTAPPDGEEAEAGRVQPSMASMRLRADLAHLALHAVPAVQDCAHVVGIAKHLCGVATDYALRCVTAPGVRPKSRGLVVATCCHHRCDTHTLFGWEHLQELGIDEEDMEIILGIVSWATCGDGRSRASRQHAPDTPRDEARAGGWAARRAAAALARLRRAPAALRAARRLAREHRHRGRRRALTDRTTGTVTAVGTGVGNCIDVICTFNKFPNTDINHHIC